MEEKEKDKISRIKAKEDKNFDEATQVLPHFLAQ